MSVGRTVETNGIELHYLDYGGGGPTLVLTHGLTANAHSFNRIAARLGPAVRLIAVDLRGRGRSDAPDAGYTMADHAADVMGLLDAERLDRVAIGGHSFGGLLTYYLAANHPERVERCVVLDAPAEVDPTILKQIQPSLDRLDVVMPSWDDYLALVQAMPYYDGWWDPAIEAFYRADVVENVDGTVRARCRPGHIAAAVAGTLAVDWPSTVARIEQPTLLLRASDPFGPPGYPPILSEDLARRTLALLPDGRLVSFPGNHITFLFGDPGRAVAEAITSFVLEGAGR